MAELRDENGLIRLRFLERVRKHHQGVRRTGVADNTSEIVADLAGIDSASGCELFVEPGERARQEKMRDVRTARARFFQECTNGMRDQLSVSLITNPSLFPAVIEFLAGAPEMIDEVDGHGMRTDNFGSRVVGAKQHCSSAVPVQKFLG